MLKVARRDGGDVCIPETAKNRADERQLPSRSLTSSSSLYGHHVKSVSSGGSASNLGFEAFVVASISTPPGVVMNGPSATPPIGPATTSASASRVFDPFHGDDTPVDFILIRHTADSCPPL